MILLDTNALIWLDQGHPRAKPLSRGSRKLYISPASLLELQFLAEIGRVRLRGDATVLQIAADPQWMLDDPPAGKWFLKAATVGWTRDPFDRLIVAHAQLRGWRLATGDQTLLGELAAPDRLAL